VSQAGGLVIAQAPETARYAQMPDAAQQTGAVDWILAPEEMPEMLLSR
jgi:two-component system CheB/CheR fusion protein